MRTKSVAQLARSSAKSFESSRPPERPRVLRDAHEYVVHRVPRERRVDGFGFVRRRFGFFCFFSLRRAPARREVEPRRRRVGDEHGARHQRAPTIGDPAERRVSEREERGEERRLRHPPRRERVTLVAQSRRRVFFSHIFISPRVGGTSAARRLGRVRASLVGRPLRAVRSARTPSERVPEDDRAGAREGEGDLRGEPRAGCGAADARRRRGVRARSRHSAPSALPATSGGGPARRRARSRRAGRSTRRRG